MRPPDVRHVSTTPDPPRAVLSLSQFTECQKQQVMQTIGGGGAGSGRATAAKEGS